jgi:hypothetical protein
MELGNPIHVSQRQKVFLTIFTYGAVDEHHLRWSRRLCMMSESVTQLSVCAHRRLRIMRWSRWATSMFWFFLLGTLLAFYRSNSVFLVSLTNSEIRLGLPLERSNLAERMKDPNIFTCPCGASYRSESHFTRHQNNCEHLLDASHRAWDVADSRQIKGPNLAQRDLRRSTRKDGNDRARDTGQAFVVRRTHWPWRRLRPTTEMTGL